MGNKQPKNATHELNIFTGDKKGAAAKSVKLAITFTDINGKKCTETVSDTWDNKFGRGETETFKVELPGLGKITNIVIERDETSGEDTWHVDRVEIHQLTSGTDATDGKKLNHSIFPINRWIKVGCKFILEEFDSILPQFEKNKEQRKAELRARREEYMLSGKVMGSPPQVEILPEDEEFSFGYKFQILVGTLVKNKLDSLKIWLTKPQFESLDDFKNIYDSQYPEPKGIKQWKCDVAFGHQKLAGCNPGIIELCTEIPEHIAATPELLEPHLEGKSIKAALSDNKIFIIDLRYLADIECSQDRTVPGATCLFYQRDSGDLVPVAIQLMPEPADDNPVFTPADPEYTWLAAKMWFNLADCSHHQSATHLGLTHLLVEAAAVCVKRRLSLSHPIHKLLAPHFIYLMAINSLSVTALTGPGGWVDKALQIGRVGMFNIIKVKWSEWNLKENGNLLNDLKRRGVDKPGVLPNYHYRDDAVLLWNAIHKYVSAIVNSVYDSEDKLHKDHEIQSWCKDLNTVAGFDGVPVKFTTKEEVIEVVEVLIYISSVGHAAANFEQYDQYGFPPNYPTKMNTTRPTNKEKLTEEYVVKSLPTKVQTLDVMEITSLLSQRATNVLGDFEVQYAYDPASMEALKGLQADMKDIAAQIDERNSKRERKYEYLNPREVPNAISI